MVQWRPLDIVQVPISEVEANCDINYQWKQLISSNLKKEIEVFLLAFQNHAITTNVIKVNIFHLLGSANFHLCESCQEIQSSCSVIARSCYKTHHDVVARIIHWDMARKGNLNINANWWDHHPVPVMHNSNLNLSWDLIIQTD